MHQLAPRCDKTLRLYFTMHQLITAMHVANVALMSINTSLSLLYTKQLTRTLQASSSIKVSLLPISSLLRCCACCCQVGVFQQNAIVVTPGAPGATQAVSTFMTLELGTDQVSLLAFPLTTTKWPCTLFRA